MNSSAPLVPEYISHVLNWNRYYEIIRLKENDIVKMSGI